MQFYVSIVDNAWVNWLFSAPDSRAIQANPWALSILSSFNGMAHHSQLPVEHTSLNDSHDNERCCENCNPDFTSHFFIFHLTSISI